MTTTSTFTSASASTGTVSNNYITSGSSTVVTSQYFVPYTTYTASDLLQMNLTQKNIISSINTTIKDNNEFKDVIEYKKNKVYGFEFYDGTKIKTIRDDKDVFSLPYAFYLALAKKIYGKELTFEGVLEKTKELSYSKYHVKLVEKGLKLFKKKQEEEAKKKQEELEKEEQHKRYVEKKKKRDQKRKEQKRNDLIDAIAYGIKRSNSDFINEYEEKLYSKKKKK